MEARAFKYYLFYILSSLRPYRNMYPADFGIRLGTESQRGPVFHSRTPGK